MSSESTETQMYLNWINVQLSRSTSEQPLRCNDIETDFKSGVLTMRLVETLIGRDIKGRDNPRSEFQMMQNNTIALEAVRDDGCLLHGTAAKSLCEGHPTLTRGFIYQLILHYQISSNSEGLQVGELRKKIISNLNNSLATLTPQQVIEIKTLVKQPTPDSSPIVLTDLVRSCNDGTVISGLVIALAPTPHGRTNLFNTLKQRVDEQLAQNPSLDIVEVVLAESLILAQDHHDIPQLIDAHSIIHFPNSNAMFAYLSYFANATPTDDENATTNTDTLVELPSLSDELIFLRTEDDIKRGHIELLTNFKNISSQNKDSLPDIDQILATLRQQRDDAKVISQSWKHANIDLTSPTVEESTDPEIQLGLRFQQHAARLEEDEANYTLAYTRIYALYDDLADLEQELSTLMLQSEQEENDAKKQLTELQQEHDLTLQQLAEIQKSYDQLRLTVQQHEQQLATHRNQLEMQARETDHIRTQHTEAIGERDALQHRLNTMNDRNGDEIAVLHKALAEQKALVITANAEKDIAEQELRRVEQENVALQAQLDELNGRIQQLETQLAQQTTRANDLENRVKEQDTTIAQLSRDLDDKNRLLEASQHDLAAAQAQIDALRQAQLDTEARHQERVNEMQTVHAANVAELEAVIAGLRDELAQKNALVQQQQDALSKAQEEIERLQQQYERLQATTTAQNDAVQQQLAEQGETNVSQLNQLQNQLTEALNRIKQLEEQLQDKDAQLAQRLLALETLQEQFDAQRSELAAAQAQIVEKDIVIVDKDDTIQTLRDQLAQLQAQLDQSAETLANVERQLEQAQKDHAAELESIQEQLKNANDALLQAQNELTATKEQLTQSQRDLNDCHEQCDCLKADNDTEQATAALAAQAQLAELRNALDKSQQDVNSKNEALQRVQDENDSLHEQLERQQREHTAALQTSQNNVDEATQGIIAGLEETITQLKTQAKHDQEQLAMKEDQVRELEEEIKTQREENNTLKKKLADTTGQVVALQKENDSLRSQLTELQAQLALSQTHQSQLQSQLAQSQLALAKASRSNTASPAQTASASSSSNEMQNKYNALKDEYEQQRQIHEKELQDMRQVAKDAQVENFRLKQEIADLRAQLEENGLTPRTFVHNENDDASKQRQRLQDEANALLDAMQPQAGVVFSSKPCPDGGLHVTKVHIGKATYNAGILPTENITMVNGGEVDQAKFAATWKRDAKPGRTLFVQVNGTHPGTNQSYHRSVKIELGARAVSLDDTRALTRLAQGIVMQGDEELLQRLKKQHTSGGGQPTTVDDAATRPIDPRDRGNKGYLDENDMKALHGNVSKDSTVGSTPQKTPQKSTRSSLVGSGIGLTSPPIRRSIPPTTPAKQQSTTATPAKNRTSLFASPTRDSFTSPTRTSTTTTTTPRRSMIQNRGVGSTIDSKSHLAPTSSLMKQRRNEASAAANTYADLEQSD